jgi:hypothetical protein
MEFNISFRETKKIPAGSFIIASVKPRARESEKIFYPKDVVTEFYGCCTKADLLFGLGIARRLAEKDGICLVITHPDDQVVIPHNFAKKEIDPNQK